MNDKNMIKELYVKKGYSARAVAAAVSQPISEIKKFIVDNNLDAMRELFLTENPNVSARIANQRQLQLVLQKQQEGEELSNSELTFLTKLADLQAKEADEAHDDFYALSGKELDNRISETYKECYGRRPAGQASKKPDSSEGSQTPSS